MKAVTYLLLENTSAEAVSVDLTGLTVGGTTAEELVLLGELYTGEETAERARYCSYASGLFDPDPGRRIRRAKHIQEQKQVCGRTLQTCMLSYKIFKFVYR